MRRVDRRCLDIDARIAGPERRLRDRFGDAFTGSIFAIVAAQPLGRLVQKFLTTRADVDAMQIVEVRTFFPGVRKVITSGA